jgi:putative ATP-grasp target RiPP
MTTPFALAYAEPRAATPVMPFTYDAKQQLNVCSDGKTLAADNWPVLMSTATTTSTAGSATHNDDD